MSNTKTKTPKKKTYLTIQPRVSNEEAKKQFLEAIEVDDKTETTVGAFLAAMNYILSSPSYKTFSFSDILYHTKPFNLTFSQVECYWETFSQVWMRLGKLEVIPNLVYDTELYIAV